MSQALPGTVPLPFGDLFKEGPPSPPQPPSLQPPEEHGPPFLSSLRGNKARGPGGGASVCCLLPSGAPLGFISGHSLGHRFKQRGLQDQSFYFRSVTERSTVPPCRTGMQLVPTSYTHSTGPRLVYPASTGSAH